MNRAATALLVIVTFTAGLLGTFVLAPPTVPVELMVFLTVPGGFVVFLFRNAAQYYLGGTTPDDTEWGVSADETREN